MSRGIKTFKTKGGVSVEMYEYITGGESRAISAVFLDGVNIEMDETGKPKMNTINASLAGKAQDKAIELLIVSVNGQRENVLTNTLELPKDDFDEIVAELDKIQAGLGEKKTA